MRITYFRLKGYINILQGMGMEELIIPFDQFKSRIILIQGENGTGKSTILKALSPNPDSNDSFRTDVIVTPDGNRQIVEYPAEKEIHYADDIGNVYSILIKSVVNDSKTTRSTKAYISRNGEELNPNGNISSFKDIRDDILGIDPTYLDMSSISSENRGLVDMIPSERRKYLASYIGSLDTFNQIYKQISKKVSSTKAYLNTINSKLYTLGNEDSVQLRLIQLKEKKESLSSDRDKLLKNLSEAETIVKLKDPDNKIQDLYQSISDSLRTVNVEMEKNNQNLERIHRKLPDIDKNADFSILLEDNKNTLNKYKEDLNNTNNSISNLISINDITTNRLDEDTERLNSISSNYVKSNIESVVEQLSSELELYKVYLESSNDTKELLDKVSLEELQALNNDLNTFKDIVVSNIGIEVSIEEVEDVLEKITSGDVSYYTNSIEECNGKLLELNSDIVRLENTISDITDKLDIVENFDNTRPEGCTIDTCPYIQEYIKIKNSKDDLNKQLDINYLELEACRTDKEPIEKSIDNLKKLLSIYNMLVPAIDILKANKKILESIPELSYLVQDKHKLSYNIAMHNQFNDFSKLNDYIEFASIYTKAKEVQEQYDSLSSDLKVYQNNKVLIDSLNDSIEKSKKEIEENNNKINELNKSRLFLEEVISQYTEKISILEELISENNKHIELENQKNQIRDQFNKVKDDIRIVKEKIDITNSIRNDIESIDNAIGPLTEEINHATFALSEMNTLQNDFKQTSLEFEKLSFIKDACSPGNGMSIQSEYVKMYMNDIIYTCNTLLGYMFNGALQLDMPIINEKQFSIPFIGPNGIQVPDVSNGSTAQKCMIGLVFSCASMMKSSNTYNILRFDEIDGGLDTDNRRLFIQVVNQIMNIMRSTQCIMVSHNSEFDTENVTTIRCSHRGISIV